MSGVGKFLFTYSIIIIENRLNLRRILIVAWLIELQKYLYILNDGCQSGRQFEVKRHGWIEASDIQ